MLRHKGNFYPESPLAVRLSNNNPEINPTLTIAVPAYPIINAFQALKLDGTRLG